MPITIEDQEILWSRLYRLIDAAPERSAAISRGYWENGARPAVAAWTEEDRQILRRHGSRLGD